MQTFDERIIDQNKVPLANAFIGDILRIAHLNGKTSEEVWQLWKKYSNDCQNSDQSALIWEFCQWNKFKEVA